MNTDGFWDMSLCELKVLLDRSTLGIVLLSSNERELIKYLISQREEALAPLERCVMRPENLMYPNSPNI